ncbi:MAG TPA: SPOR domain-containing protein [Terriglobales bacterium]|nr:SPOR domain-containing protein [Terriglobales bacterium]
MAEQDTEITLGAGKILVLFFGLVIVCAIFFGAGYTLGKNSASAQPFSLYGAGAGTTAATGQDKPAASPIGVQPVKQQDCSAPGSCGQPASEELTFYKAVEQKDPNAQLTTPAPETPSLPQQASAPELTKQNAGTLPPLSGYIVQVAAVSKQQDADALVSALRRKQYAVTVVTVPSDKLYHVQAGPFADHKEAEALRTRLINDGYNPILKR